MSQNTFVRLDQQEEKSIGASTRKALKNNKRYQENPQLYRTRQEINEHIFGTIKKTMGLQSH
jgi:hypothetical protein